MTEHDDPQGIVERAKGALMGALVGDALALGPHWYYDLDELRRDYGPWISTLQILCPIATMRVLKQVVCPKQGICLN